MNKIICDSCKEQINPLIESKHLTSDIVINYFRCNSCGVKYLIDVTDKSTRQKQVKLNCIRIHHKNLTEIADKDNTEWVEGKVKENNEAMEQLVKEIKEAKAELKERYEGKL